MFIESKIQSFKYTDKDDIVRLAYDTIGSKLKMLGSSNEAPTIGSNGNSASVATNSPASAPITQTACPTPSAALVNDIDDDIPS